jgi:peptidoglycan/LPS O-acetylase OafA/YrhL
MHGREPAFSYRPALDGLRAFAVLSVFAYHLRYSWARGGYLGVDAFFVISGYLITSLLLNEQHRHGAIELAAFWGRRARRLLPAVLLLVLGIALYSVTWANPAQLGSLRSDGWATLCYVANWHFIASKQSYFDLFSAPSPLRHMWSLAIEEQFYLVWPLVVFAALRISKGRRSLLTVITVVGIAASTIWMSVYFDVTDPSRTYYGTDTRAHSLLVGCLLAILMERIGTIGERARVPLQCAGLVAAVGVVAAASAVSDRNEAMYHGGFLLFAIGVAVVIAAAVQTTWSPVRTLLSPAPVRWVGRISYGLYLWHWPAIVILTPARVHAHGQVLTLVQVVATFAVSSLSFYLIERPIRYGSMPNRAVLVSAPAAIVIVGIVLAGATVGSAKPEFDATAPITAPPPPPSTTTTTAPPASVVGGTTTPTTAPAVRPMTIAIIGDSVAGSLSWGLIDVTQGSPVRVVSAAYAGCGIASGMATDDQGKPFAWSKDCVKNVPKVLEQIVREQKPDVVMWMSSWELSDRIDPDTNTLLRRGTPAHDRALLASIDVQAKRVTAGGAHLVFLTLAPRAPSETSGIAADGQDGRYAHYNDLLRTYAREHEDTVSVIDLSHYLCPSGPPCATKVHGVVMRPDGAHFSRATSPIAARWLLPQLEAADPH